MSKLSIEQVRNYIEKEGYKLISNVYISGKDKLKTICPFGHSVEIIFNNFKNSNSRCYICAGNQKYTYEYVKEYLHSFGYQLISQNYINGQSLLKTICPNGHEWNIGFSHFKASKARCSFCNGINIYTIDKIKDIFLQYGYIVISDCYKNMHVKIKTTCPNGHDWEVSVANFLSNRRCPKCKKAQTSKAEEELFNIIKNFIEVKKKRFKVNLPDKPWIKRFELDIYSEKLNLGIEFDGRYYHSYEYMRNTKSRKNWPDEDLKNYHEIKDNFFMSLNIKVLHIKEEDWLKNKQTCIDKCILFLKINKY